MKSKVWMVMALFIVFYFLVRLIQDMPDLVNGQVDVLAMPRKMRSIVFRTLHIVMLSGFAVSTYLILLKYYSGAPVLAVTLIALVNLILFFLFFSLDPGAGRLRYFFLTNLFYFIIYIAFGAIFFFIQYAGFKELQRKELLIQHRQSELSFLRSQLNPHFLFNSLNNIYSLVNQGSGKALEAIAGFSELMRYMLYDASENVKLSEEINYMHRYIQLQQLRFEHDLPLNITISATGERTIPPLLFIPFIENAFKHGTFQHESDKLIISISDDGKELSFFCSNKINNQHKDAGGGIGLDNVRRRLELLYPLAHELCVTTDEDRFNVKLTLRDA
ncbi:sensor histidine kinase [Flavitalea antarctica]